MRDRFVVFFDVSRPISHFGWNGAFCGAPMRGSASWERPRICPKCVRSLTSGGRHIYSSESAPAAVCGHERDRTRVALRGVDVSDPGLCERCLALDLLVVRIGPARVSLWQPQTFVPRHSLPGMLLPGP